MKSLIYLILSKPENLTKNVIFTTHKMTMMPECFNTVSTCHQTQVCLDQSSMHLRIIVLYLVSIPGPVFHIGDKGEYTQFSLHGAHV